MTTPVSILLATTLTTAIAAGIYHRVPQRIAWRRWDIPDRFQYETPLATARPVGPTLLRWRGDTWRITSSVSFKPGYARQVAERVDA